MRTRPLRSTAQVMLFAALLLTLGCDSFERPPDVVLVVLDTVRRDATGSGKTPQLERLAAQGTTFSNAWTTAPWTVPAHASLFTGLLPSTHGCTFRNTRLDDIHPTLAERMSAAGYDTAAFYSNPWLSDAASGLLRGFDVRHEAEIGGLGRLTSTRGDQGGLQTLERIENWLSNRGNDRPFFLFVSFLEAHLPYDPPQEYRRDRLADLAPEAELSIRRAHGFNAGLRDGMDWDLARRLYAGDVHAADGYLGRLIELVGEDAVIVVTSDHGENLGDHGLAEHQFSVHETLLAVPLVIRAPGKFPRGGQRDDPVQVTDLYPTLLALGGLTTEPAPGGTRSLLSPPPAGDFSRPLIAEYAGPGVGLLQLLSRLNPALDTAPLRRGLRTVRLGSLRLTQADDGSIELHDLRVDPLQQDDLAAERPQFVEALRKLLPGGNATREPGEPLDAETRRKLESLGYVR